VDAYDRLTRSSRRDSACVARRSSTWRWRHAGRRRGGGGALLPPPRLGRRQAGRAAPGGARAPRAGGRRRRGARVPRAARRGAHRLRRAHRAAGDHRDLRGASRAPDSAQAARIVLANDFAPRTAWATAKPGLAARAAAARRDALQRSAQYALARAQGGDRAEYARAAELYGRLTGEFFDTPVGGRAASTTPRRSRTGRYAEAGRAYSWAASALLTESSARDTAARALAEQAARNAVVAYDSALARCAVTGRTGLAVRRDRPLGRRFPTAPSAQAALVQKGARASAGGRGTRWTRRSAPTRCGIPPTTSRRPRRSSWATRCSGRVTTRRRSSSGSRRRPSHGNGGAPRWRTPWPPCGEAPPRRSPTR
jgi:hypothetical protein